MLYGAVLRPPSFQAKLQSVDLAAARQAGAIAAARDGEFAGCVAKTSYEARKALAALEASARWEQSPATVATPQLFDHLKQTARTGGEGRNRPVQRGDVEATLASASRRIHASFRVAYIQHAPMEPRAALAEWNNGRLTVWTGTSNPFAVRTQLAQAFQLPPAAVRVIVPHFGGGFGGKHTGEAALEAARLAREAGATVKVRWTREEEFTWAYARPAGLIEIAAALNQQGGIAAWDFVNYTREPPRSTLLTGRRTRASAMFPATRRYAKVPTALSPRRRTISRANRFSMRWRQRRDAIPSTSASRNLRTSGFVQCSWPRRRGSAGANA